MKNTGKMLLFAILCIFILCISSGCSAGQAGQNDQQPGQNVMPGELKQWNGLKGRILTDNYPQEVTVYLEQNKAKEGQEAMNVDNKTYIVATMGEQSTGGYLIELQNLALKDGILAVTLQYEKPMKDDIVTEVITYPSLVIETDGIYEGHYLIEYKIIGD